MARTKKTTPLWLLFVGGVILLVGLMWPTPAGAQCGSSASSCKNCHEVQAELPVNGSGAWHTEHAFGDFCEFCHAGNVQATDKDEAHTGMAYPLEDINASCLSCHPNDVNELADVYAVALGVTVGAGAAGGSGGSAPPAGSDSGSDVASTEGSEAAPEPAEPAANTGEIIDYNNQYERTVLNEREPVNMGNVILLVLFVALSAVGLYLVWRWEGLGDRWRELRAAPAQASPAGQPAMAAAAPAATAFPTAGALPGVSRPVAPPPVVTDAPRPGMATLQSQMQQLDPATLTALTSLLARPEHSGPILQAVARLDPRLVTAVRQLDPPDRELLLALVQETDRLQS